MEIPYWIARPFYVSCEWVGNFFSLRWWRFRYHSVSKGWNDSDTWNLDHKIAEYALPRLKRFKEINNGYPGELSEEKWDEILDKIIWSMEWIIKEWNTGFTNIEEIKADEERLQEGLVLFGEHFRSLWW